MINHNHYTNGVQMFTTRGVYNEIREVCFHAKRKYVNISRGFEIWNI